MSGFTRRRIFTVLSFAYLVALTILASYALYQANSLSLPMSNILPALVVALPPLAGILYESIVTFNRRFGTQAALQSSGVFQAVTAVLLVCESVLATLAGSHIAPVAGLQCPLFEQWSEMLSNRDARNLMRIQDTFNCCGFNTPWNLAWPIVDKRNKETCMEKYDRDQACLEPWMAMERKVAGMMLAVTVGVFLWKVIMILAPNLSATWLPSAIRLPDGDSHDRGIGHRRAIAYRDAEDHADDSSVRNEVARLTQDADHATLTGGGAVYASPLIREQDIDAWRRG